MKKKELFIIFLLSLFSLILTNSVSGCAACDGISICNTDYCCGDLNGAGGDGICPSDFGDWTTAGCSPALCVTEDIDCCDATGCGGGSCWNDAGWTGDITEKCCGDEANEFYGVCVSSDAANGGSDACTVSTTDTACCDTSTDCVFNGACYADTTQQDIDSDGFDEYCAAGEWKDVPNELPCDDGNECQSGLCIDYDHDGVFGSSVPTESKCGACDSGSGYDVCGAIAHDGSLYGVCTGAGSIYECFDQDPVAVDGDGYCIKNEDLCSKTSTNSGGFFNSLSLQGRDYIRCGPTSVCNGQDPMPWANLAASGSCVSVDSTDVNIITLVDDDATPDKISIADVLRIETFATYNIQSGAPNWKWLFECALDRVVPTGEGSDACNQNPTSASNQMTSVDPESVVQGNQIKTVNFFSPQCDPNFMDVTPYEVVAVDIFTGYCNTDAWKTGQEDIVSNPSFTVVECEDNDDAIAIANSQNGGSCDLTGSCDKSYCTAETATACPSNLDDTAGCASADEVSCCSFYGNSWELEGEDVNFGEYGDGTGNTFPGNPNPDTGDITDDIAECCEDDIGEYLVSGVGGTRCCDSDADQVWDGKCHACGTFEECDYTDLVTYPTGDCTGVPTGSSCFDGIDNDCDNLVDFCEPGIIGCETFDGPDTDCLGTIFGTVYNASSGLPLADAVIKVIQKSSLEYFGNNYDYQYTIITDANGDYTTSVNGGTGDGRTFDVFASKGGFAPKIEIDVAIGYRESFRLDFTLEEAENNCQSDCTIGDSICHSECDLWNECIFFNSQTKESCDGKQPGFKVPYGANQEVVCCEGSPVDKPAPAVPSGKKVKPEIKEDVIRITKAVIFDGETVNMIIDIFG